jgi:hypothetical protein
MTHQPQDPGTAGSKEKGPATVTLTAPNGLTITEAYHPNQKVKILLAAGVKAFGRSQALDPSKEYDLVRDATVLNADQSLEDAGVVAGDTLKIRSRALPSDGSCTQS